MAKLIIDICHICGQHKKLSFEHVPPKAAFNDNPILRTNFEKVLASENLDELQGKVQQRGSGAYTLCEKCNNDTSAFNRAPPSSSYAGPKTDLRHFGEKKISPGCPRNGPASA